MDLQEFAMIFRRPKTRDVRFSVPMLLSAMGRQASGAKLGVFGRQIQELGAKRLGPARVNTGVWGEDRVKDNAYSVPMEKWTEFCAELEKLELPEDAGAKEEKPKGLSVTERLERLERMMGIGQ